MKGKIQILSEGLREHFKAMGLEPCPLCRIDGKWDVYHTSREPCPKAKQQKVSADEVTESS